jgi:LSD1 subclass zinc finger protein
MFNFLGPCGCFFFFFCMEHYKGHPIYLGEDYNKFALTYNYFYVCNAGLEMAQLICGGCRTLLMYTRNADTVRCSCCHTVNLVRPGIADSFPIFLLTFKPCTSLLRGSHSLSFFSL